MAILLGMLFGLVAGAAARRVMPGPDPAGIGGTMLVGLAGALIGGLLGLVSGDGSITGFDFRGLLMAVIGSLIFLFSYRCFAMRAMA